MIMSKTFLPFLITLTLSACAALGTATLYKTKERIEVIKIGFVDFTADVISKEVYPKANEIFRAAVIKSFAEFGIDSVTYFQDNFDYNKPDANAIKNFCINQSLDGIIISEFKFVRITRSYDTEVGMKLFDKNGKLLISTLHNTLKGNSYMTPPSPEVTVRDGVRGATRQMTKEIKSK